MRIDDKVLEIAKKHFGIDTLEVRNRDSLDFHDVSVQAIHNALVAAFAAGYVAADNGTELEA